MEPSDWLKTQSYDRIPDIFLTYIFPSLRLVSGIEKSYIDNSYPLTKYGYKMGNVSIF